MTVAELIAALQPFDPDLPVMIRHGMSCELQSTSISAEEIKTGEVGLIPEREVRDPLSISGGRRRYPAFWHIEDGDEIFGTPSRRHPCVIIDQTDH